jgi:hypothetical protein
MNIITKTLACLAFILSTLQLSAKARIPVGKVQVVNIVHDLPNTEEFSENESKTNFLDLATFHEEFNVAWVLPLWITIDPKLVLYSKVSDTYYELSDEELNAIIKNNNLNKEALLNIGFYKKFGGKIVGVLLILLILWGTFGRNKKDDVQPKNI